MFYKFKASIRLFYFMYVLFHTTTASNYLVPSRELSQGDFMKLLKLTFSIIKKSIPMLYSFIDN